MNSGDRSQEEKIQDLLFAIGGVEATILRAQNQNDYAFAKKLQPIAEKNYEKLRRLVYGLPEEPSKIPEI